MTDKEYFEKLDCIQDAMDRNAYSEAEEELDALYRIKPVRLRWFVQKAELVLKTTHDYTRAYSYLNNYKWILYEYPGMQESLEQHLRFIRSYRDGLDEKRVEHLLYRMRRASGSISDSEEACLQAHEMQWDMLVERFFSEEITEELIEALYNKAFEWQDWVLYVLLWCFAKRLWNVELQMRNWVLKTPNLGYLQECLEAEDRRSFFIITDTEKDAPTCEMMANLLALMGQEVTILDIPVPVEAKDGLTLEQTLAVSLDNMEQDGNIRLLHPIALMEGTSVQADNRDLLINYVNQNFALGGFSVVLSTGRCLDELSERKSLRKTLQNLSDYQASLKDSIAFGWSGNYLTYISQIYGFDAQAAIDKPAECDFSIVIPARNSSAALRYTLMTCLELDYDGAYEIVISDNSTNGNQEVYELVQELKDNRIRYYKTPRDLDLPKSFEFAYLKARGEFIFSLGSDDGVLPWCLSVLTKVLGDYPEQQLVKWQRGFYAWPGFNGGQQNQFVIPAVYQKGQYEPHMVNTQDYIAKVLLEPSNMYTLPMLYINSGFRRSYFKTILEKTGRLWDGICQDIYMGIINSAINSEILEINYPLTIAGMTPASVGSQSKTAKKTIKTADAELAMVTRQGNIGGFAKSWIEQLMPELRSDVSSLYNSLLRAVARGVLPDEYLTSLFDFKQMYLNCIRLMNKDDLFFDRNVHYMRYVAMRHEKEFLAWFDEKVYPLLMRPEERKQKTDGEKKELERTYETGLQENGSLVYDASEYGVKTIYDAVQLFVQLSGL